MQGRGAATRFLLCVALILLMSLLLTARYHRIDRLGYQKAALEQQLLDLERRHQALSLEIARLGSLERVEAAAMGDLGMVRSTAATELSRPEVPVAEREDDRIVVMAFGSPDSPATPWWQELDLWLLRWFSGTARAESRP